MADLIKLKTGTIAKLEGKNANGTPTVALDKGSIYFAVDTSNHLGKIVYDAPVGTNGVDRIVMSTRAEYADEANIAQNVEGVVAINHGGTGATTATGARSNLELGNAKVFYGTCDTAAGTTEKAVTCADFTSGDLVKGAVVFVAFTNTNSGAVGSLTLNVNSTGAKSIKKYYNYTINNLTNKNELLANSVIPFVYTGTNWVALGLDYNSTYGTMSQTEADAGTATTDRVITAKVLTDTIANRIADALSDTNAMIYKGLIGATSDIPNNHQAGWVFKVSTAGTYVGESCEVGDLIICIVDGTTANDDDWMVVQKNIDKALYKSSNTFTNEHMLLADGTDGKVKSVAINPTLTLTAGTSEVGPKFKISVGGKTSSESTLGTANASTYGVTKLTNTVDASQESLAATPKLVSTAVTNGINALDVSDTADSTKYVSTVSEANGKISVSRASFSPSITVTAGDASNAPKINVTVAGNSGTAQSIGTATTAVYGATKLSNDSSSTEESLAATPKGVWAAINTLDGAITGTPGASKTVTAFNQTNGKVSATFGNISIGAGQITSGTLSVARGGTGQTSVANIKAGKDGAGNTITTTYATKAEVNDLLAATDAMIFKTVIGAAADFPSPPYDAGWTYKIGAFGTYAGKICEVGDLLICVKDRAAGETGSDDDWMVVQTNLDNGLFKGANVFADGQMLLADSTVGKVKAVNIDPEIDMTAGTASAAPKFTITVGGVESNSASIGTANTNVYGATKLSDAVNSTSTSLAATANAVKKAYDLAASKTSNVGTITGVTAGAGLTGGGTSGNVTIGHSNSITAITTEGLYKIKYDAQGHITGALLQNVTDNTSNADVSNSDTNLITGRTLYYQLAKKGYTTNTGTVKSVATGGGLTGGTITTTGTISHAVPENASNGIKGGTGRTYLQSITTDAYGHVTGYTTASETVTNTDTKVNVVARGTTKAYLLADTTAPTNTAAAHTAVAETSVYLDTTAGKLVATSFSGSGASLTSLNASNISSGTLAKERLATSGVTAGTYQGITVDVYGRVTGAVNHTYPTSLATDTGTAAITLASAGTYKLTAGGTSVIFKMPTSNNYSHPTGDGNLHIPATGTNSGGKFLKAGSTAGAISWATLTKADISDFPTSLAPTSHTHSADNITAGYLNIHPENNPVLIPFMHNDIAHLLKRGGNAVIKYDGTTQNIDISNVFDGSGSYWAINPTGITTITIELTFHKAFGYSNWIYVDFGSAGWRAKSVKIEVMNSTSSYPDDVWTQKYSTTTNSIGHVAFRTSHTPVGASNSGGGFNKVKFTFSDWATTTIFRIAQIGVYNYGSLGLRETYMSRGVDDYVFRNITPNNNNTYNLGSSSNKWATVYATTLAGNLDWSYIQNKPTLGTLAAKSSISDHSVTTPTGATSRTQDVTLKTTTVNSITAVGTLPSLTVTATDVVTGGTTTDIPNITKKTVVTGVTKKTVVTGGSTTNVPNITKKTVVTSATAAKATYANGVLTISDGSVTTGDSVTVGTAIKAYTSLTTGDSVTVTTGDSVTVGTAIKAYTALTTSSIGSASGWSAGTLPTKGSNTTVATGIKTQPTFTVTTQTTTLTHTIS